MQSAGYLDVRGWSGRTKRRRSSRSPDTVLDVNRWVLHAAALSVLVLVTACSGDEQPTATLTATATVTVTQTVTPTPSPTATPTATPTAATSSAAASTHGCVRPTQTATADWETEDVPFPAQDTVRTRWSDADIEATFENDSEHEMVVDAVMIFVRKPKGENPKPRFPMYSSPGDDFTYSNEVDPGDTFTAPGQPFGLSDWLEEFPLFSEHEPRVSVIFDWHYKDESVQAQCVDVQDRTQPVGGRPDVLSNVPWVTDARIQATGLRATVRYCAGDEAEVFDTGQFTAEAPDGRQVSPKAIDGELKVPVAASACRSVPLHFRNVTSRDWTVTYPDPDGGVPLRWTLRGERVKS